MSELIENDYQYMSRSDLEAIAVYLRSLKPIVNQVVAREKSHGH